MAFQKVRMMIKKITYLLKSKNNRYRMALVKIAQQVKKGY